MNPLLRLHWQLDQRAQRGQTMVQVAIIVCVLILVAAVALNGLSGGVGGGVSATTTALGGQVSGTFTQDFQSYQQSGGSANGSFSNFQSSQVLQESFETGGAAPTAYGSSMVFNSDAEAAGSTVTLFHSLGTDGDGTLNAWSQTSGSWSLTANVLSVSSPANSSQNIWAGHPDWTDTTTLVRMQVPAVGTTTYVITHNSAAGSYATAWIQTTGLGIEKWVGGTYGGTVASASATLTAGNWVYLKVVWSGTTDTSTVYDGTTCGTVGSQLATASVTISDSALSHGSMGLAAYNPSASAATQSFGGACAGALSVTGTAPADWSPTVIAGEPAFAWSQAESYYGNYSASIYNNSATAQARWDHVLTNATGSYQVTAYIRTNALGASGTPNVGILGYSFFGIASGNNTWQAAGGTSTLGTNATVSVSYFGAAGTAYFDLVGVLNGSNPANVVFRSLGSDATGTLGVWTSDSGTAPSISGHVMTLPSTAFTHVDAGHPDWTDYTVTARMQASSANAGTGLIVRHANSSNYVRLQMQTNGTNYSYVAFIKTLASSDTQVGPNTQTSSLIMPGSWFWLQIRMTGTSYQGSLLQDLSGYPGSQLASISVTITDSSLASGDAGLFTSYNNSYFGGNYANVFVVQSSLPQNYVPSATWTSAEPAFAYDRLRAYQGSYSISERCLTACDVWWQPSTCQASISPSTPYQWNEAMETSSVTGIGGFITVFEMDSGCTTTIRTDDYYGTGFIGSQPNWTTWSQKLSTTATTAKVLVRPCHLNGTGTVFCDYVLVRNAS